MKAIKLPAPCHLVEIYELDKIMNPKSKMNTLEKINHMIKLKEALEHKLEMLMNKTLPATRERQMRLEVVSMPRKPSDLIEETKDSDLILPPLEGDPCPPQDFSTPTKRVKTSSTSSEKPQNFAQQRVSASSPVQPDADTPATKSQTNISMSDDEGPVLSLSAKKRAVIHE